MNAFDFDTPRDGRQACWILNGDFAAHLVEEHKFGANNDYRRFATGGIWRKRIDAIRSSIHMNGDRQVCRIADRPALDRLFAASAVRLDTPAPDLENIREEIGCVTGRAAWPKRSRIRPP